MASAEEFSTIGLGIILLICLIGLVGNLLSIITFCQSSVRSSTSLLLLCLCISDLFVLTCTVTVTILQFTQSISLKHNEFLFFWAWLSKCGTKYFTIAISIERWIAICYPFKVREYLSIPKVRLYAVCVLFFASLISIISFFLQSNQHYDLYKAFILHILPLTAIIFLNVRIYIAVQQFEKSHKNLTSCRSGHGGEAGNDQLAKSKIEISLAKMLLVLVIVYSLCCLIGLVNVIMKYTGYQDKTQTFCLITTVFYVFNSSVNFLIFYFMLRNFRLAFTKLFCSWRKSSKTKRGVALGKTRSNNLDGDTLGESELQTSKETTSFTTACENEECNVSFINGSRI